MREGDFRGDVKQMGEGLVGRWAEHEALCTWAKPSKDKLVTSNIDH